MTSKIFKNFNNFYQEVAIFKAFKQEHLFATALHNLLFQSDGDVLQKLKLCKILKRCT